MKKALAILLSVLLLTACLPLGVLSVSAETYGELTYSISGGEVTITDCDSWVSGSLTIPDTIEGYPVTTIGDWAFFSCSSLTSVTIGDSVTTIGDYAFFSCYSLTTVTIPDSVTTIGDWAFAGCDSLISIDVKENNPHYCDVDGVLFDKSKTTLVQCPGGKSGDYIIPDSVTTIGDWAFSSCGSLTSVTIGDSVTTIGDWAFEYCTSLTDVYYAGSDADYANITINDYNDALLNATWHYNYTPEPTVTPGDLNADGRINNRDLGLLQQHLADWDVTITLAACDLNADGRVNNRDLGLLQQYLADWDVTLG